MTFWLVVGAIVLFLLGTARHLYRLNQVSKQRQKEIDPNKLKNWDDEDD